MGKAIIFAGLLAVLMLFGCLGGTNGQQTGAGQEGGITKPATLPGIGDSDISPSQEETEDALPGEDLLPPPPQGDVDASGLSDELSDSFSDSEEFPELISEDVIVEPI